MSLRCLLGDCLDVMRGLPVASVDSVVTDPPYGLSFMGKDWDRGVPGVAFWAEALGVAKPGAYLLAFGGTRTHHRLVCAIEDAGWEIRDEIQWVFGSGFPKSHDAGNGRGTALKPAHEPICVARKPLIGSVAANVAEWGTGAINIDGCRVATDSRPLLITDRRDGNTVYGNTLHGSRRVGETILGRWPANVIHDGSPDVLARFPWTTTNPGTLKSRVSPSIYAPARPAGIVLSDGNTGSAARFFYCAKASKADRDDGLALADDKPSAASEFRPNHAEKAAAGEDGNPYGRWSPRKNHHPTVKPTDLMRYLCRLVTPPGGTVLDPFMGSGSTGRGATLEGFGFIGIEKEPEFVAIAEARIAAAALVRMEETRQGDLFREAAE